MKEAPIPANEAQRMALLHQLNILDTDAEETYDGIVFIASHICHVPVSTITLIDHNRQWFKSAFGASHRETPRIFSFCGHTILEDDLFEVPDSLEDERFRDNPLVTGEPPVRFYAGVPLELQDGLKVGTLCVIDHKPNKLNEEQVKILRFLGQQVTKLLELRLKNVLLIQKQTALDSDLYAASVIQKSFLPPSFLQSNGLKIASFCNQAHLLGGDIFNVIKAKNKIIFYIVDVCGHDVPSALVTISVAQFFYQYVQNSTDFCPKEIMMALNEEYPFERFERFFTIFCLIIDPLTGYFTYSCAGHPPALILKKDRQFLLLDQCGTLIGLKGSQPFEDGSGILELGDKMFLYTDGIIELKNQAGEQFGMNRFQSLLETLQNEPIQTIIQEVNKSLKSFSNLSTDDMSLIGFELAPDSPLLIP